MTWPFSLFLLSGQVIDLQTLIKKMKDRYRLTDLYLGPILFLFTVVGPGRSVMDGTCPKSYLLLWHGPQ